MKRPEESAMSRLLCNRHRLEQQIDEDIAGAGIRVEWTEKGYRVEYDRDIPHERIYMSVVNIAMSARRYLDNERQIAALEEEETE